jgi:hypothetical protein
MKRQLLILALAGALVPRAHADASYESTTQVTGGTFKQIAGMSGQFSPSSASSLQKAGSTITVVQGNRKAQIAPTGTVIWDLDKATITRIDPKKKQYMVMTFEEWQQRMQQTAEQTRQVLAEHKGDFDSASGQLPKELQEFPATFDTKTDVTGATKTISGTAAHEVLLTENMQFKAKDSNDVLTYYYRNDVWLADAVPPGWQEIQDFDRRLMQKAAIDPQNNPMMALLTARPGLAEGLKKIGEAQKKQEGVPVMVVQQLGGHAEGDSVKESGSGSVLGGTGSSMTNEVVSNTASETMQKEASQLNDGGKLGIFGSSLVSSAVGAFTHHAQDLTKTATSSASQAVSPKPAGQPAGVDRVLYETTTVISNFSTEKVPASAFETPAGFTKIDWLGPKPTH